ncbi:hypothetical protein CROQUDRAFT_100640 [Cronartium quercuum f. sp. fusiforme G11]|uniref:Uncharacterized protein n=1 Tax=Cronartium quercuum f. sp. fusiforme G11 TaxID=708437 RepID=A0A9P6NA80_9BASI|nr:hypothetical protein CROQUDRAFT_100640 [Cronartium quercuum f. sp. fusiforme G11]
MHDATFQPLEDIADEGDELGLNKRHKEDDTSPLVIPLDPVQPRELEASDPDEAAECQHPRDQPLDQLEAENEEKDTYSEPEDYNQQIKVEIIPPQALPAKITQTRLSK